MKNKYYVMLTAAILLLLPLLLPAALSQGASSTVSFMMDFNINGIENDYAEVDGHGVGTYYPGDIDSHYVCLEDASAAFGIVSAGDLDYIELSMPSNYTMKMSQNYTGNRFIIPVTRGGCNTIKQNMDDIKSSNFLSQYAAFTARPVDITHLILNCSIDLVGDFSERGKFIMTIEKNSSQLIVGLR